VLTIEIREHSREFAAKGRGNSAFTAFDSAFSVGSCVANSHVLSWPAVMKHRRVSNLNRPRNRMPRDLQGLAVQLDIDTEPEEFSSVNSVTQHLGFHTHGPKSTIL
jgi:hypothetical protein